MIHKVRINIDLDLWRKVEENKKIKIGMMIVMVDKEKVISLEDS